MNGIEIHEYSRDEYQIVIRKKIDSLKIIKPYATKTKMLRFRENDDLRTLNPLRNFVQLTFLDCSENPNLQITGNIFSKLVNLKYLHCNYCRSISFTGFGNYSSNRLEHIICASSNLKSFDGLQWLTKLKYIECSFNRHLKSFKGIPSSVLDIYHYMTPLCERGDMISVTMEKVHELSGTKKFAKLTEHLENSYLSWIFKINLMNIYEYF